MIEMPSEQKISSKLAVNLVSRSRIRYDRLDPFRQLEGQVSGLLEHPGSRRMRRHS
jgi:hypothetical protein